MHYARTSDGVNIAYAAFGNAEGGVPLVCVRPAHLSHLGVEWQLPFETRGHEFETLAEKRLVVRFDSRGSGLSDRGVADISLEARCRDIDAVVDRLGLTRFALQGFIHSGSWAIAYAATRPERVSHLILVQAYLKGDEYWDTPGRLALEPLATLDWATYTEASLSNAFGWAPDDLPRALAGLMRASTTQQDFLAFLKYDRTVDVRDLLSRVMCPVLISHFQLNAVTDQNIARRIASTARDARMFLPKNFRESLKAYSDFLDEAPAADVESEDEEGTAGQLRIYLVARAETRPGVVELLVTQFGGVPVSTLAGTTTSLFDSASGAAACAKALAGGVGAAVGVHAGEPGEGPSEHADPALVTAVLAAGLAAPGEAVVSNVVRELAAGKGFGFELKETDAPGEDDERMRLFSLR